MTKQEQELLLNIGRAQLRNMTDDLVKSLREYADPSKNAYQRDQIAHSFFDKYKELV